MFFKILQFVLKHSHNSLHPIQLCHKMISAPTTHGLSCTIYLDTVSSLKRYSEIDAHFFLSASISGRNAKGETLTSVLTSAIVCFDQP